MGVSRGVSREQGRGASMGASRAGEKRGRARALPKYLQVLASNPAKWLGNTRPLWSVWQAQAHWVTARQEDVRESAWGVARGDSRRWHGEMARGDARGDARESSRGPKDS